MNRLKELRQKRGITQTELSRQIRIASSAISAVEAGDRRAWPNFRRRVSKVFGIPEAEIFDSGKNDY